jgi:hypothetical protein
MAGNFFLKRYQGCSMYSVSVKSRRIFLERFPFLSFGNLFSWKIFSFFVPFLRVQSVITFSRHAMMAAGVSESVFSSFLFYAHFLTLFFVFS